MLDVSLIDRSISVYQMGVWSQMMESDVEAWIMDGGLLVSKTCNNIIMATLYLMT